MTTQYADYTNDELIELLNDIRDFENTKILKDSKFKELVDISMENSGNSQVVLTAIMVSNSIYKEASNRWLKKA